MTVPMLIKTMLMTLVAIIVLSTSQFYHVSAMPNQSGTRVSDHGSSTSSEQLCSPSHIGTMAKVENQNQQKDIKKHDNKDDEPQPPYYLQFTCSTYTTTSSRDYVYTPLEDSIKVPLYRLYSVVRR